MSRLGQPGVSRADVDAALASLDREAVVAARWFGEKGRAIEAIELDEAFVLDPGGPHVLAIATVRPVRGETSRYSFALTGRPLRVAEPGDGAWRALAAAMADGRTIAAMAVDDVTDTPTAALVCRPARAMPPDIGDAPERDIGADQSNTSVILGEQVVLKAYRRIQSGINPDLELTAFLTEEAGFGAVPPLAGFAEVISARFGTATVAIAQAFVVDGADLYESVAEALAAWILAPGEVTVEFATEVAADIGALTAGLHAALASSAASQGFEPRDATADERRRWATDAAAQLEYAVAITPDDAGKALRALSATIADELARLDAPSDAPLLTRVHGDYHLGQLLLAPDGYWIIDFEGQPTRSLDDRRAHQSPLRDVASMLRSLDHIGRSARRRAADRNGGPVESPGLDIEAWLRRSRERFLEAYRAGLRGSGAPIAVDPDLLRAFEIDQEVHEYVYASTWMPSWLWAPDESMHALFGLDETHVRGTWVDGGSGLA